MPFGIPCEPPPIEELLRSLQSVNTQIGNLVYNVVYPIGERLTIGERIQGQSVKAINQRLKGNLKKAGTKLGTVMEGVASEILQQLHSNVNKLAGAQAAIAGLPQTETPDVPAADIRRTYPTPMQQETAAIVSNTIRQANNDVGALLSLLNLLGVTPQQIRAYLHRGTIPEVYICPNPDAHTVAQITARPDETADGFWED